VSPKDKPSIVLAHGMWADSSCFNRVIGELQAEGYEALSAPYSLDSFGSDVAATIRALGRVTNPTILVGHSYGGSVITVAGTDERVVGLVYIAGLAPDLGETSQTQQSNFPPADVFSDVEVEDGRVWLFPEAMECFAGDLSAQDKALIWATHLPPAEELFETKVQNAAWKTKPSWYIVAAHDRTVQPDLQRFFAQRMGATTHEVASSHLVMLSHPELVAGVIREAAEALQGAPAGSDIATRMVGA
jgi:pimeloyl-ACP methyl ester carboxylesterase